MKKISMQKTMIATYCCIILTSHITHTMENSLQKKHKNKINKKAASATLVTLHNETQNIITMSMYTAIKDTAKQFAFKPTIINADMLHSMSRYILVGMGGSHLAANLMKLIEPKTDMIIHSNYGLPTLSSFKKRLIILSSYSGNTQEVLDAYQKAGDLGLMRIAIATGGTLLEQAKKDKVPYVQMPDFGIQPRSALPLNLLSLCKIMKKEKALTTLSKLQHAFDAQSLEEQGKNLAEMVHGYVPIIYSSEKNQALAYIWKIKFNETGKVPAFCNIIPELNHNEMTSFDIKDSTKQLSEKFYFLFILDKKDHPEIQKRMKITAQLYKEYNLPVYEMELSGKTIFYEIFNSIALADWASYFTATKYGVEPEQVPMIEEFKKLMNH